MLPLVIDALRDDLVNYGSCVYSIVDDEMEFAIRRYNPAEEYFRLELI